MIFRNKDKPTVQTKQFDVYLLFVTLLLVFMGIVMVFSSSAMLGRDNYQDSYYFLKRELLFVGIGLVFLFIAKEVPYRFYWKIIYPLLGAMLVLLLIVLLIGQGGGDEGVYRWIRIGGFSVQPSEFAKIIVIMFVAYALAKKGDRIRDFKTGFLPVIMIAGAFILLILAQRDLGSAVILGTIVVLMLFVAGTRLVYIGGLFLLAAPALYFLLFSVSFRRQRMLAFLDPWKYKMDYGFQVIQSFIAFKSGGLSGVGLGDGKQKLFYLPEAHTDFIFSVLGEELGLIGVLLVIALFTLFIFRGLMISLKSRDLFGMYLAFGLTCLIGAQAFMNMGVVMGLLPTKGLALPFISYGGSSMLASMIIVGILLNISRHTEEDA
jgi:cell division protein FtsW